MRKNVFVTSRAPRQESNVAVNCIFCNNTGYVRHPVFKERQIPCDCQFKRPPVSSDDDAASIMSNPPTLAEAIKAKKQSCGCQTHDHHPAVSSDPAAIMSNPPTIADVLKARRAS